MSEDTPRQVAILRHALGLKPDGSGRTYRNHFVTGPGSDDFEDCEALVASGAMKKRAGNELTGGDPLYFVTKTGIEAATATGSKT